MTVDRRQITAVVLALSVGALAGSASALAQGRDGMTWGVLSTPQPFPGAVLVGCHGEPKAKTESGSCNAYRGDTACTVSLPVLCVKPENLPRPQGLYYPSVTGALPDYFYSGWSGAQARLSTPVRGDSLASRPAADQFCRAQFGTDWRMAGFHDGNIDREPIELLIRDPGSAGYRKVAARGGWGFYASGSLPATTRFWVAIRDQPANCWPKPE